MVATGNSHKAVTYQPRIPVNDDPLRPDQGVFEPNCGMIPTV